MRALLLVALVGCGGESPECGTSLAEDIFIVTTIDAYNATFGPTGTGNATWFCPGSGTAMVQGTTSIVEMTRLDNFHVTFDHCLDTGIDTPLTLTGTVTYSAKWILDTNAYYCNDCFVAAHDLTIEGTEPSCDTPQLSMTCKVDFKVTGTAANKPQSYDGSICDITFP